MSSPFNIVTKADDKVSYYVWIPIYEYALNSVTQRSYVILIPKEKVAADAGYAIPDAFTWNNTPISGYWISKYKLRS